MEDHYKVEIVHYVNPYLIWVKTCNESKEVILEQIGVYGLVPLEMTMDMLEDTLLTKKSSEWMPAAKILMDKYIKESIDTIFYPVPMPEDRSSIFDESPHKFGELFFKKTNGKYRIFSELLTKSAFALQDEEVFQHMLYSGELKMKLPLNRIKDIYKVLEAKCGEDIVQQMKLYKTAEQIDSALTVANLEAHNKKNQDTDKQKLQMKLDDLKRCRNLEMESVGRACSRLSSRTSNESSLQKRLRYLKTRKNVHNAPEPLGTDTCDISRVNASPKPESESDDDNFALKAFVPKREIVKGHDDGPGDGVQRSPYRTSKNSKKSPRNQKTPQYDPHKERAVAYGPPDVNIQNLALKVVPKEDLVAKFPAAKERARKEDDLPAEKQKEDIYEGVDSELGDFDVNVLNVSNDDICSNKDTVNNNVDNSAINIDQVFPNDNCTQETIVVHANDKVEVVVGSKKDTFNSLIKRKQNYKKFLIKLSDGSRSDTSNKDSTTSIEDCTLQVNKSKQLDSSMSVSSNISNDIEKRNIYDDTKDSEDEYAEALAKINAEYKPIVKEVEESPTEMIQPKHYVNPFRNLDLNSSVFVDKLLTPVLMVHSKFNNRILPVLSIRDVPFTTQINVALKTMGVEKPMMLQSVSWRTILRGYSVFMVGPKNCGKTMGYMPAVCRLIGDHDSGIEGTGPSCIIVCGTSYSVSEIESLAKSLLGCKERVLAFYPGMSDLDMTTSLLNGCDIFITTPPILIRLLQLDFGVDLRRLTTFVIDDCERNAEVYSSEIKVFIYKINEMLKTRIVKEVKVQYILASRIWCSFMESLARRAPDTVICIGAFQECVLYSKANTVASFVNKEDKMNTVFSFLKDIDKSKRTVIACRTDEEVNMLEKALMKSGYIVFACNSTMTVEDLHRLSASWDLQEPVFGPVLVCCDHNLSHLNVTDAHYLVHYSLPNLFSEFCKRFSVLNDNYPSIFKETKENVKIKILLEDDNVEQLPKILNFVKRCTSEVPEVLDEACDKVLAYKDMVKAKKLVPLCENLMSLGTCPDFWYCQERHAVLKCFDEPKEWFPKDGVVTFRILHYHTPVFYSASLISNVSKNGTVKYPQNYNKLALTITMYYSRESNQKLLEFPKIGDVCAVAIRESFYARAQVVKILSYYQKGNPDYVLVKLLDEERFEKTRDIYLYYLPEEMKKVETHVVQVRLANIQPKDKDVTYSEIAKKQLQNITENDEDLYLRGNVVLAIGNCVFVDNIETCRDLTCINKTVVKHDFKKELIDTHAIENPEHLSSLEKLCQDGGLAIHRETKIPKVVSPKILPREQWAHLEKDDFSEVLFASAIDPYTFFVRLNKFDKTCDKIIDEIQKYVQKFGEPIENISVGDLVLAKMPDDDIYERARVDAVVEDKVKCFFVDQGDWCDFNKKDLRKIIDKFITVLPFQAIECKLLGVKPTGDRWTDFAINWFTSVFKDNYGNFKRIYAKYSVKTKAEYTGGSKYGVALVDTNSDLDVIINDLIIQLNLARLDAKEHECIKELISNKEKKNQEERNEEDYENMTIKDNDITLPTPVKVKEGYNATPLKNIFREKPIRSVPLVDSDRDTDDDEKWDMQNSNKFLGLLTPGADNKEVSEVVDKTNDIKNLLALNNTPKVATVPALTNTKTVITSVPALTSNEGVNKDLDSDDFTSPEPTMIAGNDFSNNVQTLDKITVETLMKTKNEVNDELQTPIKSETLRKPKIAWWQNKEKVVIKILLIGAEKYELNLEEKNIKFYAYVNDTHYGFGFELYGSIDIDQTNHCNKGQYILVNLTKFLNRNWLGLTRSSGLQKWITYDMDSIDVSSSDEDEVGVNSSAEAIKHMVNNDSESEDDDLIDDANFTYSN